MKTTQQEKRIKKKNIVRMKMEEEARLKKAYPCKTCRCNGFSVVNMREMGYSYPGKIKINCKDCGGKGHLKSLEDKLSGPSEESPVPGNSSGDPENSPDVPKIAEESLDVPEISGTSIDPEGGAKSKGFLGRLKDTLTGKEAVDGTEKGEG